MLESDLNIGDTVFKILSPKEKGFVINKGQNHPQITQNHNFYISLTKPQKFRSISSLAKSQLLYGVKPFPIKKNRIEFIVHCKLLLIEKCVDLEKYDY